MSRTQNQRTLDPVERRIADTLNHSVQRFADERARRAQQNVFQRLAENILLFKIPVGLLGLGITIFILYRYVSKVAGHLLAGTTVLLIGFGFLYAAYKLVSAVWRGDKYLDGGFGYPVRIERYGVGALLGVVLYLMWGLIALFGGVVLIARALP